MPAELPVGAELLGRNPREARGGRVVDREQRVLRPYPRERRESRSSGGLVARTQDAELEDGEARLVPVWDEPVDRPAPTMTEMGARLIFEELPGGDLVRSGLADLEQGRDTQAAALVSMAAPRLRAAGLPAPDGDASAGHRLYALLVQEDGATAHGRYNALVGQVVSFARAIEHARPG